MTTLHIIRSALEFFGILLAAYAIYRADDIAAFCRQLVRAARYHRHRRKRLRLNYNHCGKVVARLRNQTLKLEITDTGVNVTAYLGGTKEGRKLYEEIKGGYTVDEQ